MELIVISYPESLAEEAQQINRLFQHGLAHFHLRKPQWETERIERLIRHIKKQYHSRIVMHSHFHLAEKYSLGGIHFSASTKMDIKQWMSFHGSTSISCHTLEELENLSLEIDYTFLSPIFDSISKSGYKGVHNLAKVKNFLDSYDQCRVFALGGIDTENAALCREAGFSGVAVLGVVWIKDIFVNSSLDNYLKIQQACQASVRM